MSEAARWLRERCSGAPERLLDRMLGALPPDEPDVAEALAAGAARLYRAVLDGRGGREDALPLLAADALFTHAFQARAEVDPKGVRSLARSWGASGALGTFARERTE